jgi:hypothetical protein
MVETHEGLACDPADQTANPSLPTTTCKHQYEVGTDGLRILYSSATLIV